MPGPTLFRPGSITTGLVGYWKLDEASGTRADSSGNGNSLTDNNTVTSVSQDYWKTGENSADFESGNSEYLSITNGSQTGLGISGASGSVTIAYWTKPESSGANAGLIGKWSTNGYMIQNEAPTPVFYIDGNGYTSGLTTLPNGRWTHLAVTFDEPNDRVTWYQNGNVVRVHTSVAGTITSNTADFRLGVRSDGSNYYDGVLKDVGVWSTVLTPIQIKSLAMGVNLSSLAVRPNSGTVGAVTIPTPTSLWKMNELSSGSAAVTRVDSVGSNNLTDNNTATTEKGYVDGAGVRLTRANTEYLSITNASQSGLGITSTWSFCTWIQLKNSVALTYALLSKWSTTGYLIQMNAGDFALYHSSSAASSWTHGMTTDVWYHLAMVYDDSADTVKWYLDGELKETDTSVTTNPASTTHEFRIGYRSDGSDPSDVILSDFAIWNGTALSDTQVKTIANGFPLQQSGFVSYWKLDETSGNRTDSFGTNTLTDNNTVVSATGKVSNGADFEASSSESLSITDGSQTGLDMTGYDCTLLGWYKAESVAANMILCAKGSTSNGYVFYVTGGGTKYEPFMEGQAAASLPAPVAGTWQHVASTLDGDKTRFYMNGYERGTAGTGTATLTNTADTFRLGSSSSGGDYLDGVLDEWLVAARYFREEEIKLAYVKGLNGYELTNEPISSTTNNGQGFFMLFA